MYFYPDEHYPFCRTYGGNLWYSIWSFFWLPLKSCVETTMWRRQGVISWSRRHMGRVKGDERQGWLGQWNNLPHGWHQVFCHQPTNSHWLIRQPSIEINYRAMTLFNTHHIEMLLTQSEIANHEFTTIRALHRYAMSTYAHVSICVCAVFPPKRNLIIIW